VLTIDLLREAKRLLPQAIRLLARTKMVKVINSGTVWDIRN